MRALALALVPSVMGHGALVFPPEDNYFDADAFAAHRLKEEAEETLTLTLTLTPTLTLTLTLTLPLTRRPRRRGGSRVPRCAGASTGSSTRARPPARAHPSSPELTRAQPSSPELTQAQPSSLGWRFAAI